MPIMIRRQLILFSAVLALQLFPMQVQGKRPPKPSAEVLASITRRGVLLAGYDAASSHASDAVEATHPKPGAVRQYIAHETKRGWVVDFGKVNDTDSKFLVSYEAVQSNSPIHFVVAPFDPAREDTGWNLAAAKGIQVSLKDFRGAHRPYNVAALPDEAGGIFVYVYLAQTKPNVYPYGADVRYRISADGTTILEKRQLHKGVIEVPAVSPLKGRPAGGYHTHVLSDLPEDTDVLLVLQRIPRVPEYVGAGGYVFEIDVTGKITVKGRLK
jgi:hypothetical protein